ncbi:MAG: glycerol dehydratase [Albidovulum sp.]|uniref:diol dehydratase small subunit n=1 Tax=Albidovulum sp. TaxID=1872424 RepID=UPI00132BDD09|nr:diol dehydratase small subunit [Defluviimonas sp.]KAB2883315.1 MAG: glycerol dehydratase [Defluviimonas sp.]
MTRAVIQLQGYPLAETAPESVTGPRGKTLGTLTMESVAVGEVEIEDIRITPQTLARQAEVARAAGREALAENFERAAEMTRLPEAEIMRIYELLRPGRANSGAALSEAAERLETKYAAPRLAAFIRQAAAQYDRRGLYRLRF